MHRRSRQPFRADSSGKKSFLLHAFLFLGCFVIASADAEPQVVVQGAGTSVLRLSNNVPHDYVGWPKVTLNISTTDQEMRPLVDIRGDQIQVLEDGVSQKVERFGDVDVPASICILVDSSRSMKAGWKPMLQAIQGFIASSNPVDEFAVLSFNIQTEVQQDFTTDRGKIAKALQGIEPSKGSSLFDAVAMTAEHVGRHGANPLKVVAIFSDGDDNYSLLSSPDVLLRLRYGHSPIVSSVSIHFRKNTGPRNLEELANETGGVAIVVSKSDSSEAAGIALAQDVRNRRELVYSTDHDKADGKLRRVVVKVQTITGASKVNVAARQGFYAPAK